MMTMVDTSSKFANKTCLNTWMGDMDPRLSKKMIQVCLNVAAAADASSRLLSKPNNAWIDLVPDNDNDTSFKYSNKNKTIKI